jgi:PhnB protein
VLGARETSRVPMPDGRPLTVELPVGDTVLAVAAEWPDVGSRSALQGEQTRPVRQ